MRCDSCGGLVKGYAANEYDWKICGKCNMKMQVCDVCGITLWESKELIKNDTYNCWVCDDCNSKLEETKDVLSNEEN